ncbi:MAG: sugar phosphate isomerase/epimerase [Bacteroidales bacterium]|nr:sugar phosphate isomerase/epimerase [Bacteroidales bacterium]
MINRRTFVKSLTASVVVSMILPARLNAIPLKKIIGIQLYTLRDLIKEDFEGTLKSIAQIGYNSVEAAGYYDGKFYKLSPKAYKKIVADNGLISISTHTAIDPKNAQLVIDNSLGAGMAYIVLPSIGKELRNTLDDYKKLADKFNIIGELCKNSGIAFAYHNHAYEFEAMEGVIPYNILLERTEPELVSFQLDTYWVVYGGYDPVTYFKNYPGRFKLWHIKDMDATPKRESTEVGQGTIDFKAIFASKKIAGMKYYFVEQESFNMPLLESVKISFDYLNNLNY